MQSQTSSHSPSPTIRVVTMRVDSAELLIDNESKYMKCGPGIVLNVSFFQDADSTSIKRAAHRLLRLPLLSRGVWGDGTNPESLLDLCRSYSVPLHAKNNKTAENSITDNALLERDQRLDDHVEVLVVPQANLTGRVSSSSTGIRYDDQAEKDTARRLYDEFCAELVSAAKKALAAPVSKTKEETKSDLLAKQSRNATHPRNMFRDGEEFAGIYSQFDDRGVPTHTADGVPLKKSAMKRVEKLYKARMVKYEKAIARYNNEKGKGEDSGVVDRKTVSPIQVPSKSLEGVEGPPVPLKVHCGVFGNRQGFRCVSSGPTMHCLDL